MSTAYGQRYTRSELRELRREGRQRLALYRRALAALVKMEAGFTELDAADREMSGVLREPCGTGWPA